MDNPKLIIKAKDGSEEVPLIEQNFTWSLTAGVTPFSTTFTVPAGPLSDTLNGFKNPVEIKATVDIAIDNGTNFTTGNLHIKECFLHERKEISEFEHQYQISDSRYFLRGKKVYAAFNTTKVTVQKGVFPGNTDAVRSKVGITNAAVLRAPFDTFATGRYVRKSVKADGKPFKMSEILEKVVTQLGLTIDSNKVVNDEGDYILENIRYEGEDVYTVLANLCKASRLNMGINRKGELYFFSIDKFDITPVQNIVNFMNTQAISPGRIYFQNMKRLRPKTITVLFDKLIETRLKFIEVNEQDFEFDNLARPFEPLGLSPSGVITQKQIDNRTALPCINVIRVPFIPSNSPFIDQINIGEFFPIDVYIEKVLDPLTVGEVRRGWWSNALARFIQYVVLKRFNAEDDALAGMIASTIKKHFRQVFMIDPFYLDEIKFWEDRRVEVVNNYSGYRNPSPLWADFTLFPKGRDVATSRGRVVDFAHSRSARIDDIDPQRKNPTAGSIRVSDRDLGIFEVTFPPLTDTMVADIVPSALEQKVLPTPAIDGAAKAILHKTPLHPDYTMETLVSVVWDYDKDGNFDSKEIDKFNAKYESIEYDYGPDAEGPPIEFLCKRDFARYTVDSIVANFDVLDALGQAEAGKIANQFTNRFVGFAIMPGIVQSIDLDGNMKAINFTMGPNDGINTTFDMRQIPLDPQIEQQLPAEVRKYLYKQLDRGNN